MRAVITAVGKRVVDVADAVCARLPKPHAALMLILNRRVLPPRMAVNKCIITSSAHERDEALACTRGVGSPAWMLRVSRAYFMLVERQISKL
jgi:hypothetical protein